MKEIKEKARIVVENLSPLLGCKQNTKFWSPRTGSLVCKSLEISSLICLDVEKEKYKKGFITYEFDNSVTIKTSNIYRHVRNYSPLVLDTSYALQVIEDATRLDSLTEQLFIQTLSDRYNDSAIIDILEEKKDFRLIPVYRHLMLVILESFSIRYSLYEFVYEDRPMEYTEINTNNINKVIKNLEYVRVKLEEFNTDETIELNHHLSTLLLNLKIIEKYISRRFIKV